MVKLVPDLCVSFTAVLFLRCEASELLVFRFSSEA